MNAASERIATQQIRRSHEQLLALYHQLTPDLSAAQCDAGVRRLCTALDVHERIEEELFHPALREAGIDDPSLARGLPHHDEIRRLTGVIRQLEPGDEALMTRVHELMRNVLVHMADVETMLLPLAERRIGEQRMAELGERIAARRAPLADLPGDANLPAHATPARTAALTVGAITAGMLLVRTLRRSGSRPGW